MPSLYPSHYCEFYIPLQHFQLYVKQYFMGYMTILNISDDNMTKGMREISKMN